MLQMSRLMSYDEDSYSKSIYNIYVFSTKHVKLQKMAEFFYENFERMRIIFESYLTDGAWQSHYFLKCLLQLDVYVH